MGEHLWREDPPMGGDRMWRSLVINIHHAHDQLSPVRDRGSFYPRVSVTNYFIGIRDVDDGCRVFHLIRRQISQLGLLVT